ncbi:MAG: primosomal protein N', partial [Acidobacteriota bacterium]
MPHSVQVAVPLPIFKTFSYSVPEFLQERVQVGCRVLVPFGHQKLVGLIVEVPEEPPQGTKLKDLIDVLDDDALVSPCLIQLGLWLSRFYFSPPGEAFRVMLPPGLLLKKVTQRAARKFWPVRKQLGVSSLQADFPASDLTVRQKKAFEKLSECELPVLVRTFGRQTGFSEGILKALAAKGAIRIEPVVVHRTPWADFGRLYKHRPVVRHSLNADQQRVLQLINEHLEEREFASLLIHGVTGSGKTEIYLRSIERVLQQGRSALILVPEIGLTPQASHIVRGWFGEQVAILHSALSSGERFDQWRRIRQGDCRVVLGTRSAVFAPVKDLGIIVLDEEHDASYKQDELPRYHAREAALQRARLEGALVVMGSATPQLETYYHATESRRYGYQAIEERVRNRPLPKVRIVDMRHEFAKRGRDAVVSEMLEEGIRKRLERKEQVLVLLNRRGYSPLLLCRSCGATEQCENCSISLTFHQKLNRLVCHYCGYFRPIPQECRECGKEYIFYVGEGTEKIQQVFQEMFPEAVVDRLDRDTVGRKGAYDRILGNFSAGRTDILVGTQMIAKGHDFPQVTLVGVLSADQALKLPDFRAAER